MEIFKYCCIISITACIASFANAQDDGEDGVAPAPVPAPPPESNLPRSNVTYKKQTFKDQQKLLVELITRLNLDPSSDIREPSANMFKILRKCSDIFKKNVKDELVLHKMIFNSMIAFQLLFEGLDKDRLTPETFADIMETLNKCDSAGKALQFGISSCPLEIEKIIVENNGTSTINTPIIPESRKFKELENDLIVEINWKIFDFCHSQCFEFFRPQFNSHHYMGYEMEKLMEEADIQGRWFRKTGGLDYLKGIISASNLLLRMKNLDFSVVAAHLNSKYKVWLVKPGLLKYRS